MLTGKLVLKSQSLITMTGKDGKEILRIEPDGDIFVHGELAENNKTVVDAFKEFLTDQGYIK